MDNIKSFLTSVEKRIEETTCGPWTTDYERDGCLIDSKGFRIALTNGRDYASFDFSDDVCKAHAQFIAHSRTDLEKAVKALRVAIQGLKDIPEYICESEGACEMGVYTDKAEAAIKEIEKILGAP